MSASVWEPGANLVVVDAESTNLSQVFIATLGQTVFTLTEFAYVPSTGAIAVYRGGQRLILDLDWEETSGTTISLLGITLTEGEVIEVVAIIGSASSAASEAAQSAADAAISASAAAHPWTVEAGGIAYTGGSIRLGAEGARITGDFSNATAANRVMFQTSTVDGITVVRAIPNGLGGSASMQAGNNTDPANQSVMQLTITGSEGQLLSNRNGTGSYLPMTFYTSGSERMRIDTVGNVGIGVVAKVWGGGKAIDIGKSGAIFGDGQYYDWTAGITQNGYRLADGSYKYKYAGQYFSSLEVKSTGFRVLTSPTISIADDATVADLKTLLNADLVNGLTVNQPVGLGYGTGSSGTVTQATSKATAVTLNKPAGQITMHNAALAAGASVSFNVVNSLATIGDVCVVGISWGIEPNKYSVRAGCGSGYLQITVKNETGGSLSEALVINFAIIKGATA